jgi:lipoprotein-anchoring transpeptidase ErfK/SrfK
VLSQRRFGSDLPKFLKHSRNVAGGHGLALTAGAALTLLAGLTAPAFANPNGLPQELRPIAAPIPELARPANLLRPARTLRAPTAVSRLPGKSAKAAVATAGEPHAKPKGPLSIMISLDRQQLTLYAGSEPIAHSRVSTGQRGFSTPTGVFSIIQKDRYHRSNIYEDAPMYFMQRITWSGVALHQGVVPNYPASHGCIRLPEAFAKQLWGTTGIGVRVIITHDEVAPREISHAKLFAPKPRDEVVASSVSSLEAAQQAWKIAQLGGSVPIAGATEEMITPTPEIVPQPAPRPLKSGPISVFISRKEGKLFVRKGFEPLFDTPVEIARADLPLGTHVFTAIGRKDDTASLRWTAVSMASSSRAAASHPSAAAALDRITIPQEAIDRISALTAPGTSVIISDHGLGPETGIGTDFIVLTR